jgi:hypothetical protein
MGEFHPPPVGREGATHCARGGRAPQTNGIMPAKALEAALIILVVARNNLKTGHRLIYRSTRGGMFYSVDKTINKPTSLPTTTRTKPNVYWQHSTMLGISPPSI